MKRELFQNKNRRKLLDQLQLINIAYIIGKLQFWYSRYRLYIGSA
jgi:hypothetical protein